MAPSPSSTLGNTSMRPALSPLRAPVQKAASPLFCPNPEPSSPARPAVAPPVVEVRPAAMTAAPPPAAIPAAIPAAKPAAAVTSASPEAKIPAISISPASSEKRRIGQTFPKIYLSSSARVAVPTGAGTLPAPRWALSAPAWASCKARPTKTSCRTCSTASIVYWTVAAPRS